MAYYDYLEKLSTFHIIAIYYYDISFFILLLLSLLSFCIARAQAKRKETKGLKVFLYYYIQCDQLNLAKLSLLLNDSFLNIAKDDDYEDINGEKIGKKE